MVKSIIKLIVKFYDWYLPIFIEYQVSIGKYHLEDIQQSKAKVDKILEKFKSWITETKD